MVTKMMAKITNGSPHGVGRISKPEQLVDKIFDGAAHDEGLIAHRFSS